MVFEVLRLIETFAPGMIEVMVTQNGVLQNIVEEE
jgi:hypothetical protein